MVEMKIFNGLFIYLQTLSTVFCEAQQSIAAHHNFIICIY